MRDYRKRRGGGDGAGGGMHITGTSNVTIVNCTFRENFAREGGGLHLELGVASATLVNCLFRDNDAIDHGGAIDVGSDDPAVLDVINCTFVNNSAGVEAGGAIRVEDPEVGDGPTVLITNSILWNNTPDQIELIGGQLTVRYSNVQGSWTGTGNINTAPSFGPGADNYRLMDDSAGVNVGNNSDVQADTFDVDDNGNTTEDTPDLDLETRIVDDVVDMGAYESVPCPWDFDGDCKIDVRDLLFLLANWVPGGPYDVPDLLGLLADWGPCSCGNQIEPLSLAEELEDACLTQDDWDEYEDVMTDEEGSQEDKDRYHCWMTHYIEHCNKCTCQHLPECPSPDPFG